MFLNEKFVFLLLDHIVHKHINNFTYECSHLFFLMGVTFIHKDISAFLTDLVYYGSRYVTPDLVQLKKLKPD